MNDTNGFDKTDGTDSTDSHGPKPKVMTMEMADEYLRRNNIGTFDDAGKWHPDEEKTETENAGAGKTQHRFRGKAGLHDERTRRARAYVAKMPPAVSGQSGHQKTWCVACELIIGFDLNIGEAMPLIQEYNYRCSPPWKEKELLHKLRDADDKPWPRGNRLGWIEKDGVQESLPEWVVTQEELFHEVNPDPLVFPLEVFPLAVQKYATALANMVVCPVDYPACAILAIASVFLGNTRALALKRKWKESPRLFIAIVAESSDGKTPSIEPVCEPVYHTQDVWDREYRIEKDRQNEDAIIDNWKRRKNKDLPPPPPNNRVRQKHLFSSNATVEKLSEIMADNYRGIILLIDEMSGLLTGMNQYKQGGKGNDRQFFLTAWSGGKIKVDRKGQDESISVSNPFLSILGGIQPDMLSELKDAYGRKDGFIERFLFTFPDPLPPSEWNDLDVDADTESGWVEICNRLLTLEMRLNDIGRQRPNYVRLDHDAKKTWVAWYNQHTKEMREALPIPHLKSCWNKMKSYAIRLSLIVHYLRWAAGETNSDDVDAISVALGCQLANYFKSHISRVIKRLFDSESDRKAEHVMAWIKGRDGRCTARELVRHGVVGIKMASDAIKMFKELQDRGFGKHLSREVNGETSHWFELSGDATG